MDGVKEDKINEDLADCENFLGTFAIDEILHIKIKQYPVQMVINFDKRENVGTHWIALSMYNNRIFICDPLGGLNIPASFPKELLIFLQTMVFQKQLFVTRQLQCLNSDTCGYYCILFIKIMCLNNRFSDFITLFDNDCNNNDIKIHKLINKMEMLKKIKYKSKL